MSAKQDEIRKEYYCNLTALDGYEFCDGRLYKLELDNEEHDCKMIIGNVLCYDDKRINKSKDVDAANVELLFKNVDDIKIKGTIRLDDSSNNKILYWDVYKKEKNSYCFTMFCIAGYEKCIFDITFSNVESHNI